MIKWHRNQKKNPFLMYMGPVNSVSLGPTHKGILNYFMNHSYHSQGSRLIDITCTRTHSSNLIILTVFNSSR